MGKLGKQGIYQTLGDVFETVFLVHLETLAGGLPPREVGEWRREYLEARIDLRCGENWPVFFFLPADLLKEIAGSFFGLSDTAVDLADLAQVGKMVAGMTIGGLLARVDPEALVLVAEPQIRMIDIFKPGCLLDNLGVGGYKTEQGYLWVDVGRLDRVGL